MKTFILFFFLSSSLFAAECKLTGILESSKQLETTLGAETYDTCRSLGAMTLGENFFGLVTKEDKLTETKIHFRNETETRTEVLVLEAADYD